MWKIKENKNLEKKRQSCAEKKKELKCSDRKRYEFFFSLQIGKVFINKCFFLQIFEDFENRRKKSFRIQLIF